MCSLRLAAAAFVAVLCATSAADPPVDEFPARFANHARLVAVGVVTGNGQSRRHVERSSYDDELVVDDATNLRFVEPGTSAPDAAATWHWSSHRVLVFTMTPETVARLKDELNASLPFRLHAAVGRGRLSFSRDHQAYSGSQAVRCAGNYRGYRISIVETINYSGSRDTSPPKASAQDGTSLARGLERAFRAVAESAR